MLLTALALLVTGVGSASAEVRLCSDDGSNNASADATSTTSFVPNAGPVAPPALESESAESAPDDAEPLSPVLDLTAFSAADNLGNLIPSTRGRNPGSQWCFSSSDPRCQAEPVTPNSSGYSFPAAIKATVGDAPRVGPAASIFVPAFRNILGEGPEGVRNQLLRPPR